MEPMVPPFFFMAHDVSRQDPKNHKESDLYMWAPVPPVWNTILVNMGPIESSLNSSGWKNSEHKKPVKSAPTVPAFSSNLAALPKFDNQK